MRSGILRHKIEIQQRTNTSDSMGGYTATWSDYHSTWVRIRPLNSSELLNSMKLENKITHEISLRYKSGITTEMRVKFGTRYFNIISIVNIEERNKELKILAEENI